MPIDNHPLPQRRLQFIGNSVNKLTFKSIYIIQSSNFVRFGEKSIIYVGNVYNINIKIITMVIVLPGSTRL